MKIREVRIRNFRNFGADGRVVSFVDPLTQSVRPLTVLVGSNGCGKTTVLEVIRGLLKFAAQHGSSIIDQLRKTGYSALDVEFSAGEAGRSVTSSQRIAFGRKEHAPSDYGIDKQIAEIVEDANTEQWVYGWEALTTWIDAMMEDRAPFVGGLLYFQHKRWVEHKQRGAIEPPGQVREWLFRFDASEGWEGSISQLWVWQNYLDLEQAKEGRPNLAPFVTAIEAILGNGRKVVIRNGRVRIEQPGREAVELHQLPSGEQQVLTLFGEIVRRVRPGCILMIDEVEISLHPALQRVVLHHLRALARQYDIQVILTTHSMEIVAAVAPEELVNLDEMVLRERAEGAA